MMANEYLKESAQNNKLPNGERIGLDCCGYYDIIFRGKFDLCSLSSHNIDFTTLGSYTRKLDIITSFLKDCSMFLPAWWSEVFHASHRM